MRHSLARCLSSKLSPEHLCNSVLCSTLELRLFCREALGACAHGAHDPKEDIYPGQDSRRLTLEEKVCSRPQARGVYPMKAHILHASLLCCLSKRALLFCGARNTRVQA